MEGFLITVSLHYLTSLNLCLHYLIPDQNLTNSHIILSSNCLYTLQKNSLLEYIHNDALKCLSERYF